MFQRKFVQSLPALFQLMYALGGLSFTCISGCLPGSSNGSPGRKLRLASEVGVFILLASWLQHCGLAVPSSHGGWAHPWGQPFAKAAARAARTATAVSRSQGRAPPSTHQAMLCHSSQLLLTPGASPPVVVAPNPPTYKNSPSSHPPLIIP